MNKLYKQIRAQIEKVNACYSIRANKYGKLLVFNLRNLVYLLVMKERFPLWGQSKPMADEDGPLKLLNELEIMPTNLS